MTTIPTITVDDVSAAAFADSLLLDVREDIEWMAGHAPGARHVVLHTLPQVLESLPRSRRIVCICRSGNRSGQATRYLISAGFDAVNFAGGMNAWATAGNPVVTPDGRQGGVM